MNTNRDRERERPRKRAEIAKSTVALIKARNIRYTFMICQQFTFDMCAISALKCK